MKWLIWILLAVMLALVGWRVFFRRGSPSYQPTPASTSAYTGRALHGDRKTRIAAIAELGRRRDPEAVSALGAVLATDKDPVYRKQAAHALGRLGDPAALPQLGAALKDPSDRVFSNACWAIGHIGAPQGADLLRPHVLSDGEGRRVCDATFALREIHTPEAEALLIERLEPEKYPLSRVTVLAVTALGDNGTRRALDRLRRFQKRLPDRAPLKSEVPRSLDELKAELARVVDEAIRRIETRLAEK